MLDAIHSNRIHWVAWNLFLAVIPVLLGYLLAWGFGRSGKRRHLPLLICLPLTVVWIAFLPNTCYLLTEWRHLLFDSRWVDVVKAGDSDRPAMLDTARWALLFLGYSGMGVLLFTLAIRPIEKRLRASGFNATLLAPPFFFLMSLGVYLGLIIRLNSWDLVNRPALVWQSITDGLNSPNILTAVCVFAAILWMLYEAVDLWLDGVKDRVNKWGRRNTAKPETA